MPDKRSLKGLVLSGGKGTRLRPFTYSGAKQLVPLANKPVLFYALEDLVAADITDIGLVVGDTADQIEEAVGDGSFLGCRITYIRQDRPGGLAHAVRTAEPFLAESSFVMYLGDNFIQGGIGHFVDDFRNSDAAAHVLLYEVPNPQDFGVAEIEGERIVSLEEKPTLAKSNLALVGIYLFGPEIHKATRVISPSARGELEITDAVQALIDDGRAVVPHILGGWWIDTGKMDDILEANRLVLLGMKRRVEGDVSPDCRIQGDVVIERGAQVISSTLRGPLVIGRGACIDHSYVGPFSAIGAGCTISHSEVEHTIVMECSRIENAPYRIDGSLIGRYVRVGRSPSAPRACNLMVGDHSAVVFP